MAQSTSIYKKGTRVVAADALRGVPEGTPGNVRIPVGITWQRYRVQFDNGVDIGSVGHSKLVPEGEWGNFKANRARLAIEAESAAEQAAAAPKPDPAPAPSDAGEDRLAALMAKSKAARESKA